MPKALGDFLILRALRESHGAADRRLRARRSSPGVKEIAATEGIFTAPEGGACVAAARKLKASGHLSPDDTVVLFDTGTGYKYVENLAPVWDPAQLDSFDPLGGRLEGPEPAASCGSPAAAVQRRPAARLAR